jgi:Zn-dependent peptidase ImmA (M78 family)
MALADHPWAIGQRFARALRQELDYGIGPINIWEVLRQRGILVARHDFGSDGGDGLYVWTDTEEGALALVVLNTARRASRQRFTAAHELGHHEMHQPERGEPDLVIVDEDVFGTRSDPREEAASAFAAYLLAPSEAIARDLIGLDPQRIVPSTVVELMRTYGLSYDAMVNRMNNAGVINAAQRDRLKKQAEGNVDKLVAQAGFDEESLFPPPPALPSVLAHKAMLLYHHGVISVGRLAELLQTSAGEALAAAQKAGLDGPRGPRIDEAGIEKLLGL